MDWLKYVLLGIKAVTPSAYNTPCGANSFTPTATPCNSPDGSPSSTRSSSPEPYETFSLPQLILSSVPQFLQQTVGGGAKKKVLPEKKRHGGKLTKEEVCLYHTFADHFCYWNAIFIFIESS